MYAPVGGGSDNGGYHHIEMKVVHLEILFKGEQGFYFGQDLSCGRAFKIEDAKGITLIEYSHCLRVIDGIEAGIMDPSAVVLFHQIQGIPDNGQAPVSQDIDFYQP